MPPAVQTRDLCKTYELIVGGRRRLAAMFGRRGEARGALVEALAPISLQIEPGESVGLIGTNGSGKSTLLKLLASVVTPTSGEVEVNGRVSALLELGTGFHPDFTGRENLVHAALLLGLEREHITRIEDEIIDFSELGDAIDDPIKTYSTGMKMRLGFSVAHAVHPQVMLIDEVLAVGDAFFQMKCHDRLREFQDEGGTFVLVSHDLSSILRTCQRVIWLDRGRLAGDGPAFEVVEAYHDAVMAGEGERLRGMVQEVSGDADRASIVGIRALDAAGASIHQFRPEQPVDVSVDLDLPRPVSAARVRLFARKRNNTCLLDLRSDEQSLPAGRSSVVARFDPILLGPGEVFWSATLEDGDEVLAQFGTPASDHDSVPVIIAVPPHDIFERGGLRHSVTWRSPTT